MVNAQTCWALFEKGNEKELYIFFKRNRKKQLKKNKQVYKSRNMPDQLKATQDSKQLVYLRTSAMLNQSNPIYEI